MSEETEMKITQLEYWEWMSSIHRMARKRLEVVQAESEVKILQMEAALKQAQSTIAMKTKVVQSKDEAEEAKKDYLQVKEKIEKRLGITLNDKMIDEVTLEVKEVPK